MKRVLFVLAAIAAMLMFACKQESYSNTTTTGTETTASAPETTGTETYGTTGTTGTSTTGTTGSAATTVSKSDQDFMTKVAEGGMMEVDLGQLAAAKATSDDVKNFGNRMVADHGKANDALKQVATNKGVTLPTTASAEETKASNELSKKSGKAFDKAYMTDMVKGHEQTLAALKKAEKTVQDPDLKNWITQTIPTVEDHLKSAKQIESKLK